MKAASNPVSPLIVLVGPTASGKSALGVWLAERLGGEVVCCDSTQVYRYFNIGAAKPTAEERRGVPHHLIDLLEPEELFTAGDYRRTALGVLEDLRRRERLPIFTVGTGLYLRALLEGLADAPTRSEELRARLGVRARLRGPEYLHRLLARLDGPAAERIAPRDAHKLVRAIEVCLLTGRRITEIHQAGRQRLEGFRLLKVGLMPRRSELYQRIARRREAMLARGWLDEVKALLARGISPAAKPFEFIGYRELQAHCAGELSLAEAAKAIEQATRHYAKHQITWFRREPGVQWFEGFGDDPQTAAAVLRHVEGHLSTAVPARAQAFEGV